MPPETCMITEIKRQAYIDAIEYQMGYEADRKTRYFIPRYEDLILQRYYESQFLCYLDEIRESQFKSNSDKEV